MRLTVAAGILSGFAAVGAATPANQAVPTQLPSVKGDWHIGCNTDNYCSYYQGDGLSTGDAGPLSARQPMECIKCTGSDSCTGCQGPVDYIYPGGASFWSRFNCYGCDHYQCTDAVVSDSLCVDVPGELVDILGTVTATATATQTILPPPSFVNAPPSIVTTVTTVMPPSRFSRAAMAADTEALVSPLGTTVIYQPVTPLPKTTVTLSPVSTIIVPAPTTKTITVPAARTSTITLPAPAVSTVTVVAEPWLPNPIALTTTTLQPRADPTPESEANVVTMTILPSSQYELARRTEPASYATVSPLPVRRNVAFSPSQCTPCTFAECPLCYDCPDGVKYMCNDIANHLTVCMSLNAVWEPPTFDISASGSEPQTTTVVTMAPITTVTTTSTVTVVPGTVIGPSSQVITVTIPTTTTTVMTIPAPPPTPQATTITVAVTTPQRSTVTVAVPTPQRSTVTVVAVQQPQPSTVTVIAVQPSTRKVVEIPMTQTTTLTRTMVRQARSTATPLSRRSAFTEAMCLPCEGNADCEDCVFQCDNCEHMVCKDSSSGQNLCVGFERSFNLIEARDDSKTSNETLGQAVSLLVRDGGGYVVPLRPSPQREDAINSEPTFGIQPGVSNGPAPYFEFNDADCDECGEGADCTDCDWQFKCGLKKKCFYNGARNVVQLCYELGQKCHV